MMDPEWVVLVIIVVAVLLIATTGIRSGHRGGSTAGQYDPDAIGQYRLEPATQSYRYELPTLPRSGKAAPGTGPPHRRRRRRSRHTDAEDG